MNFDNLRKESYIKSPSVQNDIGSLISQFQQLKTPSKDQFIKKISDLSANKNVVDVIGTEGSINEKNLGVEEKNKIKSRRTFSKEIKEAVVKKANETNNNTQAGIKIAMLFGLSKPIDEAQVRR